MEAIRQSAIGAPRMTGNALVGLGKRDSNMRRILILASLAVAALVATAAIPAEAGHRSRVGVGFHFGFPGPYYYGPAYYPYYAPYYYPRPAYYAPPAGQVIREGRDSAGNYCREYQSSTSIDGRPVPTYGTACLRPDGSWQIVN
jgi:hypothetical protein